VVVLPLPLPVLLLPDPDVPLDPVVPDESELPLPPLFFL
jgi:hypothetical protein